MLALAALLLAAVTPAPRPSPQPSNPFTLDPLPATAAPFPYIGGTRSRALCTAFRRTVAPAVQAAMQSDRTYATFRKSLFDYVVNGTEASRDLMLMRMDRHVQDVVKSTAALQRALDSSDFEPPANVSRPDAETLGAIRTTLRGVLDAQKLELDAMSGFVETERMSRFGRLSETEQNLNRSLGLDTAGRPLGQASGEPSSFAFVRDSKMLFRDKPTGKLTLNDAHLLDQDLAQIAAYADKREQAASKVIIPATERCK